MSATDKLGRRRPVKACTECVRSKVRRPRRGWRVGRCSSILLTLSLSLSHADQMVRLDQRREYGSETHSVDAATGHSPAAPAARREKRHSVPPRMKSTLSLLSPPSFLRQHLLVPLLISLSVAAPSSTATGPWSEGRTRFISPPEQSLPRCATFSPVFSRALSEQKLCSMLFPLRSVQASAAASQRTARWAYSSLSPVPPAMADNHPYTGALRNSAERFRRGETGGTTSRH